MQLYHHFYSLNSQRVMLALEEKEFDYISRSVNPVKARDLNAEFLQINPNGKLPVLTTGNSTLFETLDIIRYIDSINGQLGIDEAADNENLEEWLQRINVWNPKLFTQSHIPLKVRCYFGRFKRRVVIAQMARNPELSGKYRSKLHNVYMAEESLKDVAAVEANERELTTLLERVEQQLSSTEYLLGGSFTMADVMLIPLLARLELLGADKDYIHPRPYLAKYWVQAKKRHSYRVVIGRHFSGLNKYTTFFTTAVSVGLRDVFKRY